LVFEAKDDMPLEDLIPPVNNCDSLKDLTYVDYYGGICKDSFRHEFLTFEKCQDLCARDNKKGKDDGSYINGKQCVGIVVHESVVDPERPDLRGPCLVCREWKTTEIASGNAEGDDDAYPEQDTYSRFRYIDRSMCKKDSRDVDMAPKPSCIDPWNLIVRTGIDGQTARLADVINEGPGAKVVVVPIARGFVHQMVAGIRRAVGLSIFGSPVDGILVDTTFDLSSNEVPDDVGHLDGYNIEINNGDNMMISGGHDLVVEESGKESLTHARDLKVGDSVLTVDGKGTITAISTYRMTRAVNLLTLPVGLLVSKAGALVPSSYGYLAGSRKDGRNYSDFIDLDDLESLAETFAPVAEHLFHSHPCLFKHLTRAEPKGCSVGSEYLMEFLEAHPHDPPTDADTFLKFVHEHHDEFKKGVLDLCAEDPNI
jgi:hypothetical protein